MTTAEHIAAIQRLIMAQQFESALAEVSALGNAAVDDPTVLALHAHILRRLGRATEAIVLLNRVTRLNPRIPNAWLELARCFQAEGNLVAAQMAAESALALQPDSAVALGLAFDIAEARGDLKSADTWFARQMQVDSRVLDRRLALGNRSFDQERFDRAAWHFSAFVQYAPTRVDGHLNLAAAHARCGDPDRAATALEAAIHQAPSDPRPIARLCELDEARGLPAAERVAHCRAWLALEPQHPQARLLLAYAHLAAYEFRAAREALDQLLANADSPWPALWVRAHYPADPIYADAAAAQTYRTEVRAMVDTLHTDLAERRIDAPLAGRMLAACPNYYLGYLNDTDQTLARAYAAVLRELALASGLTDADLPSPPQAAGSRLRVVIASAHFRQHSVSRVWRDLLCALPRDRFELHMAHLADAEDDSTRQWRERADSWEQGKRDIPFWRNWIAARQADVVVYPDLGMEPTSQALASLRLAPIQVTTWGHPVSSGAGTIDYFLSSDLAEPEQADAHYSEHLVRIDGLAASYRFIHPDRAGHAPPKERTRLICMQNAFKLLPEQDDAFAAILDGLPEAELYLVASSHGDALTRIEQRLRHNLGPRLSQRFKVLGFLDYADYCALLQSADFALDSWGWSGGLTSLDAMCLGLPVLTLPGPLMRGRQTCAMLRLLGLPELIAENADDYVQRAIRLGLDTETRRALALKLQDARRLIEADAGARHDVIEFFEGLRTKA